MQTRSTRRNNTAFLQQYERRNIQQAQNLTKSRLNGTAPRQPQPQSRLTRATAAQQQTESSSGPGQQHRLHGQHAEEKEGDVIVLDDEESEEEKEGKAEDESQAQQKRRRLDSTNQSTAVLDGVAERLRTGGTRDGRVRAASPRLRPRPPLLSALPDHISSSLASLSRSLSNISSFFASPFSSAAPFSSTATHYTRRYNPNTYNTRRPTYQTTSHLLSDGRWQRSTEVEEAAEPDDDDDSSIDRTFRLTSDRDHYDTDPYLTYPPHTNRHSVTVTYGDLHRLRPNEFLNDTLIEFYLLYIRDRLVPERLRHRFHFFNSFLFTRLSEYGDGGVGAVYAHVKGWTKGVNLFEKDWIVMPINDAERHHWSLVIIAHPGRAMRPTGSLGFNAALTADRAKQKQQQQQSAANSRSTRASNRGPVAGLKRTRATPSPPKAALTSNARGSRNGKVQTHIPELFAMRSPPPPSSLLALSSPPLIVTKPPAQHTRSRRSHGEEMASLAQQQQQPSSSKRVTRQSSNDPLMSPDNQTTRRLTESKGNIRAAMRTSPYSKQQRTDNDQRRKQDEQWQRAVAVPDEQPTAEDTLPLDVELEQTEEKSASSPAVSIAAAAADALPPQYYDDVEFEDAVNGGVTADDDDDDDVPLSKRQSSTHTSMSEHKMADFQADVGSEGVQTAQEMVDGSDGLDIELEADEADTTDPILPRSADSIPPTLTLPSPSISSTSASSARTPMQPTTVEPAEASWRPCILHFDSLRIPPYQTKRIANILREYLQCEWEHQQQLQGIPQPATAPPSPPTHPSVNHYAVPLQSTRKFDERSFPQYDVEVPQQPNDYDCGVYILRFAELFCREPWDDLRRLDREGWLESRMQKEGDKRRRMRQLLEDLHGEDEFERAKEQSRLQLERELEQKQREHKQQQPHGADMDGNDAARHKDVYVPDSDDEEESRGTQKDELTLSGASKRTGGRRQSSGRRVIAGDNVEQSNAHSLPVSISRTISMVPSSQPAEDDVDLHEQQ